MAMSENTSAVTVLVTGGSGYIGSHTVDHLLKEGYRVKAATRPGRESTFTTTWPAAVKSGQLILVEIADITTSDFTQALEDVSVLVHVAAKIVGKGATAELILDAALRGTANVIEYALKAGVKKIVYTSSFATLFDPSDFKQAFGKELVDEDAWGSITKKEQLDVEKSSPISVYAAAKTIAETDFWKLAEANPDVDFTAILPSGVMGGFLPSYPLPEDRSGLGMANGIYSLIAGGSGGPNTYPDGIVGHVVHVSDVARAHVLAITAPRLANGRKRCIISAPERLVWPAATEYLLETRSELKDRLPSAEAVSPKQTGAPLSNKVTEEVLGIKPEDYIGWKVMVEEGIDTGLRLEKKLAKA